MGDYRSLARLYQQVRSGLDSLDLDRGFLRKTAELVQEHTRMHGLQEPRTDYDVRPEALEEILKVPEPDAVKVIDLIKSVHTVVTKEGPQQPFLIPIGERADQIAEAFRNQQISVGEALDEYAVITQQIKEGQEKARESDLSKQAYAVSFYLQTKGVECSDEVAHRMEQSFDTFPHWRTSNDQEREIRTALYAALIGVGVTGMAKEYVDDILNSLRKMRA